MFAGVAAPSFPSRIDLSPPLSRTPFLLSPLPLASGKSYFDRATPPFLCTFFSASLPTLPKLHPYAVTPFGLMNFKIMPRPAAYEIRASIFADERSDGRSLPTRACRGGRGEAQLSPKTKHEMEDTRGKFAGRVPRRVN